MWHWTKWVYVTAKDKVSEKDKEITIKNDKGRLSKEDVEQMINEAEKQKEEDDKQRERINEKNAFENYVFQMKNTINDVNLKKTSSVTKCSFNNSIHQQRIFLI